MDRYARQTIVKGFGKENQKKLQQTRATVVGVGALGTVVSELLVRSGIGKLILIDRDFIELNNLQRQTLFNEHDVGKLKTYTAKEKLNDINSETNITAVNMDLDNTNIDSIKDTDVIYACTDNFESKFLLNDFCKMKGIPLVVGSCLGKTGHVFNVLDEGPCLKCIMREKKGKTCETGGILNTVSTIIASLMVSEGTKIILDNTPSTNMIHFNQEHNQLINIEVNKKKDCPACSGQYLELKKTFSRRVKICGKNAFMYHVKGLDYETVKSKASDQFSVKSFRDIFHFNGVSVFRDGRILISAKNEEKAEEIFSDLFS